MDREWRRWHYAAAAFAPGLDERLRLEVASLLVQDHAASKNLVAFGLRRAEIDVKPGSRRFNDDQPIQQAGIGSLDDVGPRHGHVGVVKVDHLQTTAYSTANDGDTTLSLRHAEPGID